MRKLGCVLCFLVAAASIIFAFMGQNARGWLVGLAFFRMMSNGGFMGMIGNIFGVLLTAGGFGATGYFGLMKDDKNTLIASSLMCGVCIISLIVSIFSGTFVVGDIFIIIPCGMVLVSLFTSSSKE